MIEFLVILMLDRRMKKVKPEVVASLENDLDDIMLTTKAKGVSASVGIPDHGIWYAAQGVTGSTLKEKITPDLKFCAGSIGKTFTAIVILKLVEEGKVVHPELVEIAKAMGK